MIVEYELTHDEYVDACAEHLARSPLLTGTLRKLQAAVAALCVVMAALQWLDGWGTLAVFWLVAGLGLTAGVPWLTRAAQRRQLLRTAAAGVANGMFGHHRVSLLEEGMRDETSAYEWTVRWSAVDGVRQVGDVLMLYIGPNAFLPIPLAAFPDPESALAFRERFLELADASDPRRTPPALEVPTE